MSQLLHPSALDDFGLPATLTAYLRNFSHRTGIRAQLAETMDMRLAAAIELCVYRIVQEALNNVAQHSGASACTVSLSGGRDMLRLVIEDNGCGPAAGRFGAGRGARRDRYARTRAGAGRNVCDQRTRRRRNLPRRHAATRDRFGE
jgi:signal transduction histidine kinase